jgi:hypothetical protein
MGCSPNNDIFGAIYIVLMEVKTDNRQISLLKMVFLSVVSIYAILIFPQEPMELLWFHFMRNETRRKVLSKRNVISKDWKNSLPPTITGEKCKKKFLSGVSISPFTNSR